MNRNTKLHFIGSAFVAVIAVLTVFIATWFGGGWATAALSIFIGVGVEAYQFVRKEGTPFARDAAMSASVGVVLGLLYELGKALQ